MLFLAVIYLVWSSTVVLPWLSLPLLFPLLWLLSCCCASCYYCLCCLVLFCIISYWFPSFVVLEMSFLYGTTINVDALLWGNNKASFNFESKWAVIVGLLVDYLDHWALKYQLFAVKHFICFRSLVQFALPLLLVSPIFCFIVLLLLFVPDFCNVHGGNSGWWFFCFPFAVAFVCILFVVICFIVSSLPTRHHFVCINFFC